MNRNEVQDMKFQKYFQTAFVGIFLFCFAYTWAVSSSQTLSCKGVISNLNEWTRVLTQNAEFSNSKEHRHLFQFYRMQFLGQRDTERTLEDVMNLIEEYPKLSKPVLREQILTLEERHYEPSQRLREVVQRLKGSADQFQAQFFQPEANIGFWQRLLMPLKKEELTGLSNQEKKAKQKEHKAQFREYFDQVLTPEDREILQNTSMKVTEKTIAVYRILEHIRDQMIEEGRDVQALSQAMVDLVHTSGFRNSYYLDQLKSQNALDQIKGLEQIFDRRNTVALELLNFDGQFQDILESLNVDHPTGSTKNENLSQVLLDIQREIPNSPYTVESRQVFRVRALSLQESPFRGCLGRDCSTNTAGYFDLALDPNFLYFTLTNSDFESESQITVVLGTARSKKEKRRIKIAFVDKIQEVPQAMILPMLEAVRLSLEELGYRLGLPVDAGGNNGLSDTDAILEYIDSEVNPLFTNRLTKFKPHWNRYKFDKGYSRAYFKPELLEFEGQEGDFKIEAGEIYTGSKIPEELKVEDFYQEILSLRDSDKEEDQIRFINHLKSLIEIEGLELSEDFSKDYLKSKMEDRQVSFKVRKKALYTLVSLDEVRRQDAFHWIINNFSENEQTALVGEISNWIDSNEGYKQDFIDDFLYEFLKVYIKQKVQFSFQSIVLNILSRNMDVIGDLLSTAVKNKNTRIINYLLKDITMEQLREIPDYALKDAMPFYMNQNRVQSLRGEDLEFVFPYFTEKQKIWVKPEQFETVSFSRLTDIQIRVFARYIAEYLNQEEVESLEGKDLEILLPHLTNEQKERVNKANLQYIDSLVHE